MIVCIAEKPSVGRDIARIIGATKDHKQYMEGNGYQVTWTFGHLCTLKEPHDYTDQWKRWSLGSLPMLPQRFGIKLIEDNGIKQQFAVIERLMQQADGIINCGDAGQEGELIQRWVMQKAGAKCPVKRLWISSMTDEAIREGFAKLKDQSEYQPLYLAGLSRAIGDWILGMNATRLYTLKYGQNKQVLSIGRVQTPTLALIVNRQKEIDSFKPEPYWVLATVYRDTTFTATKAAIKREQTQKGLESAEHEQARTEFKGKFTSKEEGEEAFKLIEGRPFTVTSVEKKKGTEAPPQLYDLTSLQVDCNKKFGLSAELTLNLIQSLYEKKITTYPRVDTRYLSDDIYPKCPQTMNGLFQTKFGGVAPYAELVRPLGGKALRKSKKVFDSSKVTDHHAIIPTGVIPNGLSDLEKKVFNLVALRFIAVFYPDCKFSTTTVMGEVQSPTGVQEVQGGKDSIEFKATGKEILEAGWHDVYKKEEKETPSPNPSPVGKGDEEEGENTDNSEEKTLPTFVKGESGPHKPTLTEKWTTPPPYYTEATLLRAMETAGKFVEDEELRAALKENGIGRPSSRAGIIETLFKRHYIRRERKHLVATPTGIELIDIIKEELLKSCELTGIWEKKLRDIEHQKYDAGQFVEELKQQITMIVNDVLRDSEPRHITLEAPPQPSPVGREKSPTPALPRREGRKKRAATKKAKSKEGATQTNHTKATEAVTTQQVPTVCPLCGRGTVIRGRTAYGCSRWNDPQEPCSWRLPFEKE